MQMWGSKFGVSLVVGLGGLIGGLSLVANGVSASVKAGCDARSTDPAHISHAIADLQEGKHQLGDVAACFAEGTSDAVVKSYREALVGNAGWPPTRPGQDFIVVSRWPGTVGTPITLTWSFVPDGLSISSGAGEPAANSSLFSALDTKFSSVGGRAKWMELVQACFDRWENLTGVDFERVNDGVNPWDDGTAWGSSGGATRGDIRISAKPIDGPQNMRAYAHFPSNGDIVLDSVEGWQTSTNNFRTLRNVVMHEIGHALGLDHLCPTIGKKLMERVQPSTLEGVQPADLVGIQTLYGDGLEPNDSFATATDMGLLAVPSNNSRFGSRADPFAPAGTPNTMMFPSTIVGKNDQDFFSFEVAGPAIATVKVFRKGDSFRYGAETTPCLGELQYPVFSPETQNAPIVKVFMADQANTLYEVKVQGDIQGRVVLPQAGKYYVFVQGWYGAPTGAMPYDLTLDLLQVTQNEAPIILGVPGRAREHVPYQVQFSTLDANPGQTASLELTDGPPGMVLSTTGLLSWTPSEAFGRPEGSLLNFTITARDNGTPVQSRTKVYSIQVEEDHQPPTITNCPSEVVINEGSEFTLDLATYDPDDSQWTEGTWSVEGLPEYATFSTGQGFFRWSPWEHQGPGEYIVKFKVQDVLRPDLFAEATTKFVVREVNQPPKIEPIDWVAAENSFGHQATFWIPIRDEDLPAQPLQVSVKGLPKGARITKSGSNFYVKMVILEEQAPREHQITVTGTDGEPNGTTSRVGLLRLLEENVAPVFWYVAPKTVKKREALTFQVFATDRDVPAQNLSYSALEMPPGAAFNPLTRTFSWTPAKDAKLGNRSQFVSRFQVSDGARTATLTVPITVIP